MTGVAPPDATERPQRSIARDLVVAWLVVVLSIVGGGVALYASRDNTGRAAEAPVPLSEEMVTVPDLVGMTDPFAARGKLAEAMLNYELVTEPSSGGPTPQVVRQEPAPGTVTRSGSVVRVFISRAGPPN